MATIIEESEALNGHRMATVRSDRGREYVIDIDVLACLLAETLCDRANERAMGWNINPAWYQDEWRRLSAPAHLRKSEAA